MDYFEGTDRDQRILFPQSLDEYIAQDNPVRVIDAFVESVDLQALGFTHTVLNETGRPPYHPGVLLRLYVYGYLNRLRSSRSLEREAQRNVEVMWLTRKLAPDFKTIANFRRNKRKAIREVCRAFTIFCRDLDLFSRDLVAIYGNKFKAVNSRERNFTDRKLQQALKDIDQKIEAYLEELDANDAQEPEERKLSTEELKEKIKLLKERMKKYKGLLRRMEETGESQISLTDPDSRSMPIGGGRITDVGYNVQVAVDPKHKLLVDHQVTNAVTERGLLASMAIRAKEALGIDRLEVLTPLRRPAGQGLPRSGHHPLHPQTQHLRQHSVGPVWQRRLPLRSPERLLPVPGRRATRLPLAIHREGARAKILHHPGLRPLCPQTPVHTRSSGPPYHPLDLGGSAGPDAGQGQGQPRQDEAAEAARRAPLWDHQTRMEPELLPHQRPGKRERRDEPDGAGLQHQAGHPDPRSPENDESPGLTRAPFSFASFRAPSDRFSRSIPRNPPIGPLHDSIYVLIPRSGELLGGANILRGPGTREEPTECGAGEDRVRQYDYGVCGEPRAIDEIDRQHSYEPQTGTCSAGRNPDSGRAEVPSQDEPLPCSDQCAQERIESGNGPGSLIVDQLPDTGRNRTHQPHEDKAPDRDGDQPQRCEAMKPPKDQPLREGRRDNDRNEQAWAVEWRVRYSESQGKRSRSEPAKEVAGDPCKNGPTRRANIVVHWPPLSRCLTAAS